VSSTILPYFSILPQTILRETALLTQPKSRWLVLKDLFESLNLLSVRERAQRAGEISSSDLEVELERLMQNHFEAWLRIFELQRGFRANAGNDRVPVRNG
jgi:hypothetical protein